ncbi:MAG: TIGR00153 family protein [Pseudomonadales bacterium]|nr:TIGR00153 family protein [Pseudomonadales bacterium]
MASSPLFLSLFKKSRVALVHAHLQECARGMDTLLQYFDAVFREDWVGAEKLCASIGNIEHDADTLKREVRLNVPRSVMNSVSREDLLELVHTQDQIANTIQDIAGLVLGRKMSFPDSLVECLREFLNESHTSVSQAVVTGDRLIELAKTGFNNRGAEVISDQLKELHRAEKEADRLQRELRAMLFSIESTLKPVDVMFIYKILDLIGDISDLAQSAGNRMLYIAYS